MLLIRERITKLRQARESGRHKQVIAFLAPTKVLVSQQHRYIARHCDAVVRSYTGDYTHQKGKKAVRSQPLDWTVQLKQAEILVLTPEIMRKFLGMYDIYLNHIEITLYLC